MTMILHLNASAFRCCTCDHIFHWLCELWRRQYLGTRCHCAYTCSHVLQFILSSGLMICIGSRYRCASYSFPDDLPRIFSKRTTPPVHSEHRIATFSLENVPRGSLLVCRFVHGTPPSLHPLRSLADVLFSTNLACQTRFETH